MTASKSAPNGTEGGAASGPNETLSDALAEAGFEVHRVALNSDVVRFEWRDMFACRKSK